MAPDITPRERVWQAIRHCETDRVPYQFGYTVPARLKLEAYYGAGDLDARFGNHMVKYRARHPGSYQEIRPDVWRDEFGVIWNRKVDKDIGVVEEYQLAGRSLDGYLFPDPHDPRRCAGLAAFVAAHPDHFRYLSVGFSLFERAWSLRGMADLLVDMLEAPAFVDELLDAILAFDMGILEDALGYDIDAVMFGDDWGQQTRVDLRRPPLAQVYQTSPGRAIRRRKAGGQSGNDPQLREGAGALP